MTPNPLRHLDVLENAFSQVIDTLARFIRDNAIGTRDPLPGEQLLV
jgi:hypothetical protein